jgi:hypothetical protein
VTGEYGECVLTRVVCHGVRVDRADPLILISQTLLDSAGEWVPGATVDGDLLTINAINGTWVYRIGDSVAETRSRRADLVEARCEH